jgi:hypothetical protein
MKIMELSDGGVASFQAFHVAESGDGLDGVQVHGARQPVHGLSPGPKGVGAAWISRLNTSAQGALKGMRMDVSEAFETNFGHGDTVRAGLGT